MSFRIFFFNHRFLKSFRRLKMNEKYFPIFLKLIIIVFVVYFYKLFKIKCLRTYTFFFVYPFIFNIFVFIFNFLFNLFLFIFIYLIINETFSISFCFYLLWVVVLFCMILFYLFLLFFFYYLN